MLLRRHAGLHTNSCECHTHGSPFGGDISLCRHPLRLLELRPVAFGFPNEFILHPYAVWRRQLSASKPAKSLFWGIENKGFFGTKCIAPIPSHPPIHFSRFIAQFSGCFLPMNRVAKSLGCCFEAHNWHVQDHLLGTRLDDSLGANRTVPIHVC